MFDERLPDEHGHLRVVGRLARVPAPAAAHLPAVPGFREPRGEGPLGPELERRAERVPDGGAEDRAEGTLRVDYGRYGQGCLP